METKTNLPDPKKVPCYFPLVHNPDTYKHEPGDPIEIVVGMEATYGIGSDCYPYEVIEIRDAKTVLVRQLEATAITPVKSYGDTPNYLYTPNPEGRIEYVRQVVRRGRTIWALARPGDGPRAWVCSGDCRIHFGRARYYQDPSF